MGVKDRIYQFCKERGIAVRTFEQNCGLSNGYVSSMRKGIGVGKLENVLNAYPEINREWLLYGEGEMLRQEGRDVPAPVRGYASGVPYYNVDFVGGFDLVLNDQTINPEYLIDFPLYNRVTCWCNITGHSMEPEIANGDIIALKEVSDPSFLPFGEVYAIITTNGMRTVKRIGPASSPDYYSLIPSNKSPEYGVQEIPKSMILKVYQVLGCMKKL